MTIEQPPEQPSPISSELSLSGGEQMGDQSDYELGTITLLSATQNLFRIREMARVIEEKDSMLAARDVEIARLNAANVALEKIAVTDPLMGIGNRRYLDQQYKGLVAPQPNVLKRSEDVVQAADPIHTAIQIDLDKFSFVNNTHGHLAGDTVLQGVGGILKDTVRSNDILGRYGGEEIVIILPRTTPDQAEPVAQTMRVAIENASFGEPPIKITASFGIAELAVRDSLAEGIQAADIALYEAKNRGRNQVVRADQLPELGA